MLDKLKAIAARYLELQNELNKTGATLNQKRFAELAKEQSELSPIYAQVQAWQNLEAEITHATEMISGSDSEMATLAREELKTLQAKKLALETDLKKALLPKDPNDGKNILLEIRAGTGGDEAALFAAVLFRLYSRFAERQGLRCEIASSSDTGLGGYKEVILLIQGKAAYSLFRFESGVHRVQRVPRTEAQGRIHTSTVTVAVMPEVDEVEVQIKDEELRIDVFRSGGPGGQSVNTTDSAVRITHLPTGIVVSCQDEKSQLKNKAKGLKILRARILDQAQSKQHASLSQMRKLQIGSGDRSERIRTYNYPQTRVTDHRINFTSHRLDAILDGDLTELVDQLKLQHISEQLAS